MPAEASTATIQAIRSTVTAVSSLIEMRQPNSADRGSPRGPIRGIPYLAELEPELRGAVILGPDGEVLENSVPAASGFAEAASSLVDELVAHRDEPLDSAHIASDGAEVFVVSEAGLTLVAVAARFVLASLMTYDIRMTLRDLSVEVADA
jgi:hypothetical protein